MLRYVLFTILSGLILLTACTSNSRVTNLNKEVIVTGMRLSGTKSSYEVVEEAEYYQERYRDNFQAFDPNPIKLVAKEPVSTFSADVDTASYSYMRRRLNDGHLPNKDSVRLEELVNYFDYRYPQPEAAQKPFRSSVVVHDSPWAAQRKLIHIGIQGYSIETSEKPDSNLVFLLDVSGSMNSPDKLPLVKKSMNLLLRQLKPTDTVAIVAYAGAAGTILKPTQVKYKRKIMKALKRLSAGGSTAGGEGIELAYSLAEENFNEKSVNRIILATDGDFNVGIYDRNQLKQYVERKREKGIYLSVLGFGQGNYQDQLMQTLAQNGNGIAAYIDTLSEAQKVLVHEATSSLFPIATDLKLQVEFNPKAVKEYRLLGYETRQLKREDFNNDRVDAGDVGSGHSVTAIYEVTLINSKNYFMDKLRYKNKKSNTDIQPENELAFLSIRYKLPGTSKSVLEEQAIVNNTSVTLDQNAELMREVNFSTAVAAFGQLLKNAKYLVDYSIEDAITLALENRGRDEYGYRSEFVQLMRKSIVAETEM